MGFDFTLILATVNRVNEVELFIESLCSQTFKNFELIIIDQNRDERLKSIIDRYNSIITIRYIKSDIKGLSHARNKGIILAQGEIIAFPDDDCIYPTDLLDSVKNEFQIKQLEGLSISLQDSEGRKSGYFDHKTRKINRISVWTHISSVTIFLKKRVVEDIGLFDESLGVGESSIWKAGEDKDYPLRVIKKKYKMEYIPYIYVIHEDHFRVSHSELDDIQKETLKKKIYEYSAATGYVMKKHKYSMFYKLSFLTLIMLKIVYFFIKGEKFSTELRLASLIGRIHGYLGLKKREQYTKR